MGKERLPLSELLKIKRWNTPSVYNGWESYSKNDRCSVTNVTETRDFMPQMGPMIGYALTVVCEPCNPEHQQTDRDLLSEYTAYLGSMDGPSIVVIQDLDNPSGQYSFWGEVSANIHRSLGCVGTITDGAVRDIDEMCNAGFKAIAKRLCVGHGYASPIKWGCEVEVFGKKVLPGQLIHADKHGFIAIPEEDEAKLYEATCFMDANECNTMIQAGRTTHGKSKEEIAAAFNKSLADFRKQAKQFNLKGEW